MGLTEEERETVISWCEDDEDPTKIFIHTTQRPMMRKLLSNPLFEKSCDHIVEGEVVGVEGWLPKRALSIRRRFRVMSEEQKAKVRDRFMKNGNSKVKQ